MRVFAALVSVRKYVAMVAALVLAVLLSVVAFALAGGTNEPQKAERARAALGAVPSGVEVASMRTEHSRSYRQPDGSVKTKLSLDAVNYRGADGKWKPVDSTLKRTSAGVENAAGALKVRLPDRAEQGPVRVQLGDAWVSFGLRGAKGAAAVSKNTARYPGVLPGVSLRYDMGGSSLKESLVLASPRAANSYAFDVQASAGLTPELSKAGEVVFRDRSGKRQLAWAAPWMKDAAGVVSHAVRYEIDPTVGGWTVRVIADERWLQAKDRRFPVEVDPTTYVGFTRVCEIASGSLQNTSNCTTSDMTAGVGRENGRVHRLLVKFDIDEIRSLIGDDQLVTSADFFYWYTAANPATVQLNVHELTRSFEAGATWNTYDGTNAWTYPGGDGQYEPESWQTMYSDWVGGWVGLGVGRLVQGWMDGTIDNHGIGVIPADESLDRIDNMQSFGLVIESRPKTGAQPQATFEEVQPTAGSKARVNVANGNLVLTETDLTAGSGNQAIGVQRKHNSLGDLATGTPGSGWVPRYGAETTLWQHWVDRSYILEGPGGLAGRFHRKADYTYQAPPGWNATLVENNDSTVTVTFTDTGEAWHFDTSEPRRLTKVTRSGGYEIDLTYGPGGLVTLEDNDENTVTYTYDAQTDELQSISDGTTSRQYTLTGGKLLAVAPPSGGTGVQYSYDSNDRLTEITYPGASRLAVAYDSTGRVTSLTQKPDSNPANDLTTTFAYSSPTTPCLTADFGKTTVTYPNAQTRTYCHERNGTVRAADPATSSDVTDPVLTLDGAGWTARGQWHREGVLAIKAYASDAYSGVKTVETRIDNTVVDTNTQSCSSGGCSMQRDIPIDVAALYEGTSDAQITVTDIANRTTTREWPLKVDRTEPSLSLDGTLWTDRAEWADQEELTLTVESTDATSGVSSVEVLVDGERESYETQACSTDGCGLSATATVDAGELTPGSHTIEVIATDHVGNERTEDWTVTVAPGDEDDYPSLQLDGSLAAADGQVVVGGRLVLEITATPGNAEDSIRALRVAVGDEPAARWSQTCQPACSMEREFELDVDQLNDGLHEVLVEAVDATGRTTDASIRVRVDREVPVAPSELVAETEEGAVRLHWKGPEDADTAGYNVYRAPVSGGSAVKLTSSPTEQPTWLDESPGAHASDYTVRTVDYADNESEPSAPARVSGDPATLAVPGDLLLRSHRDGLSLTWEAVNGAVEYAVYRKESSWTSFDRIATTSSSQYVDREVHEDVTYTYVVRPLDNEGRLGPESAPISGAGFDDVESERPLRLTLSGDAMAADAQGEWLTGDDVTVTADALASEDRPGSRVTELEVLVEGDSAHIEESTCSTPGCGLSATFTIDLSDLDDGYRTLEVVARDDSGEETASTLLLRVDRVEAPVVTGVTLEDTSEGVRAEWDDVAADDIVGYEVLRASTVSGPYDLVSEHPVPGPEFTDLTVAPHGTYHYVLRAVDRSGGRGGESAPVGITRTEPLEPPATVSATGQLRAIAVTWAAATGAAGYDVYRRQASGTWRRIASPSTTAHTDTAVLPGQVYEYAVRTRNADRQVSGLSSTATAEAAAGDIRPEISLAGSLVAAAGQWLSSGSYSMDVSATETDPLGAAPGITQLEVSVANVVLVTNTQPCALGNCSMSASTNVEVGDLPEGQHELVAIATDAVGETTIARASVFIDRSQPAAPTDLGADSTPQAVGLVWTAPSTADTAGYIVERSTTATGTFTSLTELPVPDTSYSDSSGSASTRYWYRVRAVDAAGNLSPASRTVSASRSSAAASAPQGVTAQGLLGRVTVSWNAATATDLDGYRVYAADAPSDKMELVSARSLTHPAFVDFDVTPGFARYYEVRAVSRDGEVSPPSSVVSASAEAFGDAAEEQSLAYWHYPVSRSDEREIVLADDEHPYGSPAFTCAPPPAPPAVPGTCVSAMMSLAPNGEDVAYVAEPDTLTTYASGALTPRCGPALALSQPGGCAGGPGEILGSLDPSMLLESVAHSHDGQRIYYSVDEHAGDAPTDGSSIWRMNADGTAKQEILAGTPTIAYSFPAEAADGSFLIASETRFENGAQSVKLVRLDLSTGELKPIDLPVGMPLFGRPSPDGRWIAFLDLAQPGRSAAYVARADGSAVRRIGPPSEQASLVTWSPSGQYLLMERRGATPFTRDLVRISAGGQNSTEVIAQGIPSHPTVPDQAISAMYAQPSSPELVSNLPAAGKVSDGTGSIPINVEATDPAGVKRLATITAAGVESLNEDCSSGCPSAATLDTQFAAGSATEGRHAVKFMARSANGAPATLERRVIVDRTAPEITFETIQDSTGLDIDLSRIRDATLADGNPGTGVETTEYRLRTASGWGSWVSTTAKRVSTSQTTVLEVEVKVTDWAGNSGNGKKKPKPSDRFGAAADCHVRIAGSRVATGPANVRYFIPEHDQLRFSVQYKCDTLNLSGKSLQMSSRIQIYEGGDDWRSVVEIDVTEDEWVNRAPTQGVWFRAPKGVKTRICRDWIGKQPRFYRVRTKFQVGENWDAGTEFSEPVELRCPSSRNAEVLRQAEAFKELAKFSTDITEGGRRNGGQWLKENLPRKPWPHSDKRGAAHWNAHHIVPMNESGAREARALLFRCRVHPNHKDNGVWLRGALLRADKAKYQELKRVDPQLARRTYHPLTVEDDTYHALLEDYFRPLYGASDACKLGSERSRVPDIKIYLGAIEFKLIYAKNTVGGFKPTNPN